VNNKTRTQPVYIEPGYDEKRSILFNARSLVSSIPRTQKAILCARTAVEKNIAVPVATKRGTNANSESELMLILKKKTPVMISPNPDTEHLEQAS
jgi:hypothetical protein